MCLALLVALSATGAGYAMWEKELLIDGTVETGEVNAEWTTAFSNDDGIVDDGAKDADDDGACVALSGDSSCDPSDEYAANATPRYDKDVADCIVTGAGEQTIEVTLVNAYPSYYPTVIFDIDNTGTIPVKIQAIEYSVDGGGSWQTLDPCVYITITLWPGIKIVIAIVHTWGVTIGQQIDPGESAQGFLSIHVEQDSDELASGSFMVRVHLVQWNEYTP